MLPKAERVEIDKNTYKKIWIYGAPFSGKTTLADESPMPINLNTDGNVKYVTMQRLPIKDEVTAEGRITKRKYAWDIFKEAVVEFEKGGTGFETIVVDLLEDTYEHCRLFMYKSLGISHESDDSFRAWDKVRIEYLSTLKKLLNLPYNIILISHEDTSKDITKKSGDKITAIKPNINDKVATKIAGMVDIVARVVIEDDDSRTLNFKTNEVVFGGGRLKGVKAKKIPLSWDELMKIYDEANEGRKEKVEDKPKQESRRSRKSKENKLVAEEDKYFYHAESESYWKLSKGEVIDLGDGLSYEISKEEYEKGIKTEETQEPIKIQTASMYGEIKSKVEGEDKPVEDTKQEEKTRRRRRKAKDEE